MKDKALTRGTVVGRRAVIGATGAALLVPAVARTCAARQTGHKDVLDVAYIQMRTTNENGIRVGAQRVIPLKRLITMIEEQAHFSGLLDLITFDGTDMATPADLGSAILLAKAKEFGICLACLTGYPSGARSTGLIISPNGQATWVTPDKQLADTGMGYRIAFSSADGTIRIAPAISVGATYSIHVSRSATRIATDDGRTIATALGPGDEIVSARLPLSNSST